MTDTDAALRYHEIMGTITGTVIMADRLLAGITDEEINKAARTVEAADAAGAVVNPTKYREALGDKRLEHQRNLLRAARYIRTLARQLATFKAKR